MAHLHISTNVARNASTLRERGNIFLYFFVFTNIQRMDSWKIILAIVVIVIILIVAVRHYAKLRLRATYGNIRFGCFVNEKNPGSLFPLTGKVVMIARIDGRYMFVRANRTTHTIVPMKCEIKESNGTIIGSGYIVIPAMTDNNEKNLILYMCSSPSEKLGDQSKTIASIINSSTGLPNIIVSDPGADIANVWNFNPISLMSMRQMKRAMGFAPRGMFVELPAIMPKWVTEDADLIAGKVRVSSFTNIKQEGLKYECGLAVLEPWGDRAFAIRSLGSTVIGAIIAIPTSEPQVFRIFDMTKAMPNISTDIIENHMQLVATNGTTHSFSKNLDDSDSAHWKMIKSDV